MRAFIHRRSRARDIPQPADIAVQWACAVPDRFHARASATARRYAYVLLQSPVRPSVDAGRVGWVFRPLDGDAMSKAARMLEGEHDFTSFRAAACQALSPVKTLQPIRITRRGDAAADICYWHFEFEANAFLHHMIRNIMGCLVAALLVSVYMPMFNAMGGIT